ncbi:hypothetical protein KSP40_PGU010443 [Platanthera guangdongensis]|uniref:Uncharacterized protein n=1 Tax=Platanthera guangdongensis TaxID=2320717 RepID=A0ABR2LM18_9ASPA
MLTRSANAADFKRKNTSRLLGMATMMKHELESKNDTLSSCSMSFGSDTYAQRCSSRCNHCVIAAVGSSIFGLLPVPVGAQVNEVFTFKIPIYLLLHLPDFIFIFISLPHHWNASS